MVSDEIHADIVYPGNTHIPLASLSPEIAARTITITSATKSFNIPALRCAVMHFGAPALKERFFARIPPRLLGSPGVTGVDATIAAWDDGQPWLDEILAQLQANRDWLAQTIGAELAGRDDAAAGGDLSGLARLFAHWTCRARRDSSSWITPGSG